MRTLNVRFLAILVGCAVALGIGVGGVHYLQMRRHANFFLDKAETADAKETLTERFEAANYYRQYLSVVSSDSEEATEARAKLGMLYAYLALPDPADPAKRENPAYYRPAYLTLEQALRGDPTRSDVRRKLVEVAMRTRPGDARDHLKILLDASPEDAALKEMMAQCQIANDENSAAEETLTKVIEKNPTRLESYVRLANLLRQRMDRDADADAWMNKLVEANPKAAAAYCRRGEYLRMARKAEDADKDAAKAIELAPDDEDALLLAARCAIDKEQYDDARRYAEHAVKLFPKSVECYGVLSSIESTAGRPAVAREWLDKGLLETDEDPELLFDKARYELTAGETEKAGVIIEKLERAGFPAPLLSHLRSWAEFLNGNWASASKGFEGNRPELLKLGRWAALARHGDVLASQCYERLSLPEKQKLAMERARELGAVPSGDAPGPLAKAKALAASGNLDAAVAEYRGVIASGGAPATAWRDLAMLLFTKNMRLADKTKRDWSEVETALQKAAETAPDDVQATLLRAELLIAQDRQPDAEKLLQDTLQEHVKRWNQWTALIRDVDKEKDAKQAAAVLDGAVQTWAKDNPDLTRAKTLLEADDRSKVAELLALARARQAKCSELWMALVQVAQRNKNWDRAATLLDDAEKQMGDSVSLRGARGLLFVQRGGENVSEALEKLGQGADAFSEQDQQQLWTQLSLLARQAGDLALAVKLCRAAADKQPNNLQIRQVLFDMALVARDEAAVETVVEEVRRIENEGPYWHYMQAVRLASSDPPPTQESLNKALEHLAQARIQRPTWEKVPMLIGWIHDKLGNKEAAINNYKEGVAQGSREVAGLGRLQQLLMQQGRTDEAMRVLDMLEQQKAGVPYQALLGRAQENLREGNVDQGMADLDRAADDLRKIAADSNKYEDQMRLAGILMAQGQIAEEHKRADDARRTFDEAETTLRRAIELAPQQPAIRLKWVQLLHRRNKTREAEQAIADARKALPPDKAHLALAQCYELLGRLAEAEQQYEAAVETTPDGEDVARNAADFYLRGKQVAKGEAILKSIVQGERKVSPDDLTWARRRLALLLLERGDLEGRRNAIAMLDDNLKTDPQSLVDQRLKARALALKGTRKDRQEARAMFESLVGIPQPLPQDRFELAKIVMVDEGWNSASRQMQPLLALNDVEPAWLQFYIRAQIENNELDGAEANLKRLEQLLPNHFSAAFFHAQILSQRGKHDAAMAALADFLKMPKAEPNDRTIRLSLAAQALEQLAKSLPAAERDEAAEKYLQQAETYYRDFVTLRPDQEIVFVGFLGRRGRREEALKLAETAAEKAQPVPLATTLVDLVTKGTPTPEEIQRAEKILAGATEKHGRSVPLLLATADLRIVQQRYDDAEKLYRDAIRDEENNFVAMNDLACFLSLRKSKLDEALKLVDKAIQLAGPLAALYDTRATVYLAKGQWKESLDDMETALGDEPNGTRYFHQAQALFLGRQKEAASAAMKEADKAGLTVDDLRPIERPAYRQLQQDLQ